MYQERETDYVRKLKYQSCYEEQNEEREHTEQGKHTLYIIILMFHNWSRNLKKECKHISLKYNNDVYKLTLNSLD